MAGEAGGFNGEAADTACVLEADDGAGLLDDAGEHGFILREQGTGNREQGTGNREQRSGL
jgi:hypothetical protein